MWHRDRVDHVGMDLNVKVMLYWTHVFIVVNKTFTCMFVVNMCPKKFVVYN